MLEQLVRVGAVLGEDADADARADVQLVALELERLVERVEELRRDALGGLERRAMELVQEQDELVAALAGQEVAVAQHAQQPAREAPQELVAGGVAQHVVDEPEVVEVDREEGEGGARAARAGERAGEGSSRLARLGRPVSGSW